jgi:hypothetical protein
VRLGFLSERQHESVVNACRYRLQRDYDKRFGRQVLRMSLLDQKALEKLLDVQKRDYSKSAQVTPLADMALSEGLLVDEQVEQVHRGIQERDAARRQLKGRALAGSGKTPGLGRSTTTPVLGKGPSDVSGPASALDDDLDDIDLDDDGDTGLEDLDDLDDLDDIDLDDDDDASDLDDIDLDDDDLDDVDLDDDDDASDLDDVDLDEDASDLDDIDIDDLDEGEISGIDDIDLDDDDLDDALDGIDLDDDDDDDDEDDDLEADGISDSILDGADPIDIDAIDLDDDDDDGDDDEADLAAEVSELASDVELDEEDLKALDEMDSGDQLDGPDGDWADAFDDRPLHQRPPSERMAAAKAPSSTSNPPLPSVGPPPEPPSAPLPEPDRIARAARETDMGAVIPGGDVFEGNLSDMGATDPLHESAERLIQELEQEPSEERRSLIESAVTDAFQRATDRFRGDAPPPPPPLAPHRATESEEARAVAAADAEAEALAAAKAAAAAEAATLMDSPPALDLSDPRVRQAFDRAMSAAWEVFVRELEGR